MYTAFKISSLLFAAVAVVMLANPFEVDALLRIAQSIAALAIAAISIGFAILANTEHTVDLRKFVKQTGPQLLDIAKQHQTDKLACGRSVADICRDARRPTIAETPVNAP